MKMKEEREKVLAFMAFFLPFLGCVIFLRNPTQEKERKKETRGGRSELEVVHALLLFLRPFASNN